MVMLGMHLGALMNGGVIEVFGNAGDWLGGEMKKGKIHVHGDAGQQVGAAYRGSMMGMKGGTILVDGNAGIEVGMRMRRGLIVIGGAARDFRWVANEGRYHRPLWWGRNSYRRVDATRHDHLVERTLP